MLLNLFLFPGNPLIDENDFLNFIRLVQNSIPSLNDEDMTRDLSAAFKVFDLDGDGYITKEELKVAMEMIDEPVSDSQLTQLIQLADTDHDNKINYEVSISSHYTMCLKVK